MKALRLNDVEMDFLEIAVKFYSGDCGRFESEMMNKILNKITDVKNHSVDERLAKFVGNFYDPEYDVERSWYITEDGEYKVMVATRNGVEVEKKVFRYVDVNEQFGGEE